MSTGLESRGFDARTARRWSEAIVEGFLGIDELATEFGVSVGHMKAFIASHGYSAAKSNRSMR